MASNDVGITIGPDATFTTGPPTPPVALTGPASAVGQNKATITATIDTQGLQTNYGFEIATSTNYGPPTGLGSVPAGASEAPVLLTLSGLLPGATYHYRIEASSLDGTSYGADETFTTPLFANAFTTPPPSLPFVASPATAFPAEEAGVTGTATSKKLTRAQKLADALQRCRKESKRKRGACIRVAERRYGPPRRSPSGGGKKRRGR